MGLMGRRQATGMADEGQGQGIKELLTAEKKATQIVNDAKKKRADTMKKAKEDAQQEIADYKAKREQEFQTYKLEHSTGGSESSSALAKQTEDAIADLQAEAARNRSKVVDLLVKYVTTVSAQ